MEEMIIMTEISMPNDEDWNYYLQNTPDNYLQGVLVSLLEENRFFADYRFLKLLLWYVSEGGKFCTTELTIKKDSSLLYRARVYSEKKRKQKVNVRESQKKTIIVSLDIIKQEALFRRKEHLLETDVRIQAASHICIQRKTLLLPSQKLIRL